mgnify:CR=1 FL=1
MKTLQRGRVDAPVLLAITVAVTLFTVLPMLVSITAGLTNNFSRGLASAPAAFARLMAGRNQGKALVVL